MFSWMSDRAVRIGRALKSMWRTGWGRIGSALGGPIIQLHSFDQVLKVERDVINFRRKQIDQEDEDPKKSGSPKKRPQQHRKHAKRIERKPLPDPIQTTPGKGTAAANGPGASGGDGPPRGRRRDEIVADRPLPQPNDSVGLALSGGGIRSAALSIGALQALDYHDVINSIDYLSSVSGGGYAGASLTAGMSVTGGMFPFTSGDDIRDNLSIGQIRNYSNYLMPRARSGLRNFLEVAAVLLRGLCANSVLVFTFLLLAALATWWAYPNEQALFQGSFLPRLVGNTLPTPVGWLKSLVGMMPLGGLVAAIDAALPRAFGCTLVLAGLFAVLLILWAISRSLSLGVRMARAVLALIERIRRSPRAAAHLDGGPLGYLEQKAVYYSTIASDGSDVNSWSLAVARTLLGVTILSAALDSLPLLAFELGQYYNAKLVISLGPISGLAAIASLFASRLGAFLETTKLSPRWTVRILRVITKIAIIAASLVLPLVLLIAYLHLAAWLVQVGHVPNPFPIKTASFGDLAARPTFCWTLVVLIPIVLIFEANSYSLHQFYKDRLSKAFLFYPSDAASPDDLQPLLNFKLSQLTAEFCPYHIVNAALNVQGSREANRRGRNADFFMFTPDFIGSDLTLFAQTADRQTAVATMLPTPIMEGVDRRLDLGSAMAISGAALSANMGSDTVRWLSPTLALLNVRLGYWLRNPWQLAGAHWPILQPLRVLYYHILGKFFLLLEMFNLLDEKSAFVFLSDGGHIENLGIYQLLKRGCRLIIAIDAEADPSISCPSLLKLERYARIDLGVRIILPWEEIAARNRAVNADVGASPPRQPARQHGPHCALGRIVYGDGTRGLLLYVKSSLSGDEKDYVLDYKKRNPDFPHENTGDQFFTEEQFEVYRSLGYHMVDGFFSNADTVSWLNAGQWQWPSLDAAKAEVRRALHWAEVTANA